MDDGELAVGIAQCQGDRIGTFYVPFKLNVIQPPLALISRIRSHSVALEVATGKVIRRFLPLRPFTPLAFSRRK